MSEGGGSMYAHLRMTKMKGADGKIWAIHGVPESEKTKPAEKLAVTDPLAWLTEHEWWQLILDYNSQTSDPRDQLMRRGA